MSDAKTTDAGILEDWEVVPVCTPADLPDPKADGAQETVFYVHSDPKHLHDATLWLSTGVGWTQYGGPGMDELIRRGQKAGFDAGLPGFTDPRKSEAMYTRVGDDFVHVSTETTPIWDLRLSAIQNLAKGGPPSFIGVAFRKVERDTIDAGSVVLTPSKARAIAADLLGLADRLEALDRERDGIEPSPEDELPPSLFWSADHYAERVVDDDDDSLTDDRLATFNLARCWRFLRRALGWYPSLERPKE